MEINSGPLTFIQVSAIGQRVGKREKWFGLKAMQGESSAYRRRAWAERKRCSERWCEGKIERKDS